jgi:RNA polymerase sigma-70 factor (ECF subfamily)
MSELDLVAASAPEVSAPSPDAYVAARAALLARMEAETRPRPRRWIRSLVPAGAAAGAIAAAAVLIGLPGVRGGETASAASVALREAAEVASVQQPPSPLEADEFVYTKSVNAYLSTMADTNGESVYSVLLPRVREIWLASDGNGWLSERSGEPTFLSAGDREGWVAAGRPPLGNETTELRLQSDDVPGTPNVSPTLPEDPDALYRHIEERAAGYGNRLHEEMFTLVGDALRETSATPVQRAALYEVAARIPGVELVGSVTDRAGRDGTAVAMRDDVTGIRHTLIFDPETSALLEEEEVVLADNGFDYPEGTVIGYATYLESAVVDKMKKRP